MWTVSACSLRARRDSADQRPVRRLHSSTDTSRDARPIRSPLGMLLQPLDHGHDVSLAVLEPGGPGPAPGGDAVLHLAPGDVVLLEHDAAGLELGHLRLDVLDLP